MQHQLVVNMPRTAGEPLGVPVESLESTLPPYPRRRKQ